MRRNDENRRDQDAFDSDSDDDAAEARIESLRRHVNRLREKRAAQERKSEALSRNLRSLWAEVTAPISSAPATSASDSTIASTSSAPVPDQDTASASAAAQDPASASSSISNTGDPQQNAIGVQKSRAQEDFEWAKQQPRFALELEDYREKFGPNGITEAELEIFAFVNTMEALRPRRPTSGPATSNPTTTTTAAATQTTTRHLRM